MSSLGDLVSKCQSFKAAFPLFGRLKDYVNNRSIVPLVSAI